MAKGSLSNMCYCLIHLKQFECLCALVVLTLSYFSTLLHAQCLIMFQSLLVTYGGKHFETLAFVRHCVECDV